MVVIDSGMRRFDALVRTCEARGFVLALVLCGTPLSSAGEGNDGTAASPAGWTSGAVRLEDGAELAYCSRPGSPTLVLIPGTGRTRKAFPQAAFLDRLDPSFGIVIVETRGIGGSWPPPTPAQATMEHYADDVLAVVGKRVPTAWYVSGHSLGGMLAIEIGGRRPRGLRGLIPLEGWVHYTVEASAFREPDVPKQPAFDADGKPIARPPDPGWTIEQKKAQSSIWRRWTAGERILATLDLPMLAVWGDHHVHPRPTRRDLLIPDRPNIEIHWIEGSGHEILDTQFASEVANAINGFVHRTERTFSGGPDASRHPNG